MESERKFVSYGKVGIVVLLFLMLFTVPVAAENEYSVSLWIQNEPYIYSPVDSVILTPYAASAMAELVRLDENGLSIESPVTWKLKAADGSDSKIVTIDPINDEYTQIRLEPTQSAGNALLCACDSQGNEYANTTIELRKTDQLYVNFSSDFKEKISKEAINLIYRAYVVDEFGNYIPNIPITWNTAGNTACGLSPSEVTSDLGIEYYNFAIKDIISTGKVSFTSTISSGSFKSREQTWSFEITDIDTSQLKIRFIGELDENKHLIVGKGHQVSAWVLDQYDLETSRTLSWQYENFNEASGGDNNEKILTPTVEGTAKVTVSDSQQSEVSKVVTYTVDETEEITNVEFQDTSLELVVNGGSWNFGLFIYNQVGQYVSGNSLSETDKLTITGDYSDYFTYEAEATEYGYNVEFYPLKPTESPISLTLTCAEHTFNIQVTITALGVTEIKFSEDLKEDLKKQYSLGTAIALQAIALDGNVEIYGNAVQLEWSVTDSAGSSVLTQTVESGGIIEFTPSSVGTYTVTVAYGTHTATTKLEIFESKPTSYEFQGSRELEVGTTNVLAVILLNQANQLLFEEEYYSQLTWEITSGSELAEVQVVEESRNRCVITSLGNTGTVTIQLKYNGEALGSPIIITIYEPNGIGKILCQPIDFSLETGVSYRDCLSVSVFDAQNKPIANPELTWTVDKPEVLKFIDISTDIFTVKDSVTAKSNCMMGVHTESPGTATITVSAGGQSAQFTVTVYTPSPTTLQINQFTSYFALNTETILGVEVLDQMGNSLYDTEICCTADSTMLDVLVDNDARTVSVTPKKTGTTSLKISSGSVSKEISITIQDTAPITVACDQSVIYGLKPITISGTSTSETVYFYMKSSGEYVELRPFTIEDSEYVSVSNGKWSLTFTPTAFVYDNSDYIIRVTTESYTVDNKVVTEESLNSGISYAEIQLNLQQPSIHAASELTADGVISINGIAEGTDTLQYYLFDSVSFKTGTIPVNSDYEFSFEIKKEDIQGWIGYLIIQHPMYDGMFNVKAESSIVSLYETEGISLSQTASKTVSLENIYGVDALNSISGLLDSAFIDDTHTTININFIPSPVIIPDGGTYNKPLTVSLSSSIPDAKIYYTMDDENIFEYTGPFVLTGEEEIVIIQAFVMVDEAYSDVSRATFTRSDDFAASESVPIHSGSSKDTGSGNYNEYPRTVTDGGEVSFGTSKIVKSVDLPKGLSGEVKLIAKSETPGPDGKETYNVFEINIPNYPKGEKAVIRFTISVSELEANGFGPADICLYHYDEEDGWTPLSTSYKVTDSSVFYESEATSFSPFAIVFEKGAATERVDAEVPEDILGVTPGEDEPLPSTPDTPAETPQTPSPVFGVIAGLLGAGLLLRRK